MPHDDTTHNLAAGRFRALTGLTDKALRLYAERGLLVPDAVDSVNGYRSYSVDQLRDGIALDLLRRAKIPLDDLDSRSRFRFDDHRGKIMLRRAMEDFYLDLAERFSQADAASLAVHESEAGPAHWIAAEVPFEATSSPEEAESTFSALAVDLPQLDRILLEALRSERIELVAEAWTTSAQDSRTWLRLAHAVTTSVSEDARRRVEREVIAHAQITVRVTAGTLPARRELVYSSPEDVPTDDEGLADTTLSYLSTIAFSRSLAEHGREAVGDTARRRVRSTSMFDPSAVSTDVFDVRNDSL